MFHPFHHLSSLHRRRRARARFIDRQKASALLPAAPHRHETTHCFVSYDVYFSSSVRPEKKPSIRFSAWPFRKDKPLMKEGGGREGWAY